MKEVDPALQKMAMRKDAMKSPMVKGGPMDMDEGKQPFIPPLKKAKGK